MTAADDDDASPASSGELDDLLNLLGVLWLDIQLRSRVEGAGPCRVYVLLVSWEGDRRVNLPYICLQLVVHYAGYEKRSGP